MSESLTICFDYYDGVTEGLLVSLKKNQNCYFKLLAWDEKQDQRLFFSCDANRLDVEALLAELSEGIKNQNSAICVMDWNSLDDNSKNNIAVKIKKFWSTKRAYLTLGNSFEDNASKRIEIEDDIAIKVSSSLNKDRIGSLSDWESILGMDD